MVTPRTSENQHLLLKKFWLDCGGVEIGSRGRDLSDDFANEMAFFLEHCPKLISDSNKKFELQEREEYEKISEYCGKLLSLLQGIPEGDRINILSLEDSGLTQILSLHHDKPVVKKTRAKGPLCDPLKYIEAMATQADEHRKKLRGLKKHERQLRELHDFVNRFPPLKNIRKNQLCELAHILWPNINVDSFKRAYEFKSQQLDQQTKKRKKSGK